MINIISEFLGFLQNNKEALASITFVLVIVIGWTSLYILQKILLKLAAKTTTKLDDIFVEKVSPDILVLFTIIAFRFFVIGLNILNKNLLHTIDSFITIYVTIIVAKTTDIAIRYFEEKLKHDKEHSKYLKQAIYPLLKKIINITYYVIAFIVILYVWDVNIGPLLGGLGIVGLAVSFAAKDTLENFISGITLAFDKSFNVGDMISIPEMNIDGLIYDLGLRSTKVLSWDNELYIVPNSRISNSIVQNPIYPELKARSVISFSVGYGSDVDKVKQVALSATKGVQNIIDDPAPSVLFKKMADSGIVFELRIWVNDVRNRFTATRTTTENLYKALVKNDIEIPYPTQTLFINFLDKKEKSAERDSNPR